MSRLPLLISVPHAGLAVPPEVAGINMLTPQEIAEDGDEGAAEIYSLLKDKVAHFVTADIARAFVDLNRAADDFSRDGVVKTHTCWDVPVYHEPLAAMLIETLLEKYYRPYHARLSKLANQGVKLAIDCHTMAAIGPPVGPDAGAERPVICLGNINGKSCPSKWIEGLQKCFAEEFDGQVAVNEPFAGGFITRSHCQEMPWIQLELSRAPYASSAEKGRRVSVALEKWCSTNPF
jgi:formiminoglutamase